MKRIALILSALLAAIGTAGAQDTIRYPDSCYMYNPFEIDSVWGVSVTDRFVIYGYNDCYGTGIYQPDSDYLASNGYELMQDPLSGDYYWIRHASNHPFRGVYQEYVASGQTWIYGIAATTGGSVNGESIYPNWARYLDSIYTLAELRNVSQITDSNFNLYAYVYGVSNGRTYCIDSVKWIRHNNPYRFFEYQRYPARGFESYDWSPVVTYSYEFYFDKPVSVADTFFIGARFPYANDFAQIYPRWSVTGSTSKNITWEYQNGTDIPAREIDFCNHHNKNTGLWGCYFPILTPRDTTRCDPPADLRIAHATDTSVMLEWYGGNATQWEVEYAEADGTTAYYVTTITPRVTLTGLRPTTTYVAHVRAWCTRDSEYGEWSSFIELNTTAHQPDTTQEPDTVSIDAVGLFTRLMPNPASGMVTVQSSYSLNHVAVYDVRGHLVLEQKAAGNAATFDVGHLPKGVYVISIRTTAGTTTKRLMVEN